MENLIAEYMNIFGSTKKFKLKSIVLHESVLLNKNARIGVGVSLRFSNKIRQRPKYRQHFESSLLPYIAAVLTLLICV